MRKIFLAGFILSILFVFSANLSRAAEPSYPVHLYLFHSDTCPHCREELKFLDELKEKYPNLKVYDYELSKSRKNQGVFEEVNKKFNLKGYVPVTVIGDQVIVGFDKPEKIGKKLEERISECSQNACPSDLDEKLGKEKIEGKISGETEKEKGESVKLFGREFRLESTSLYVLGAVLGLADGINPCMFSVLFFLLAYLMSVGSKKKAIKAGAVFIITTFVMYFLVMYGFIKIVDVLKLAGPVRLLVILFALIAGAVMIKDYFFYGKWFSFEIPKKYKPKIEVLVKKGTIPSAIALAILSTLVELPCTSGLPLVYISVIAQREVYPFWYLMLYNVFFVMPLALIVLGVGLAWTKTEKLEAFREKSKRYMRLAAGLLLVLLAVALWRHWI